MVFLINVCVLARPFFLIYTLSRVLCVLVYSIPSIIRFSIFLQTYHKFIIKAPIFHTVINALYTLTVPKPILLLTVPRRVYNTRYQMLDRLLILRSGQLIYGGRRTDALPYLAGFGYVPEEGENPADFFIEVSE